MPVKVSQAVKDAFEEVRDMGVCNMLDRKGVQAAMNDLDHYEAVIWIEDNKRNYGKAVMRGLEVDPQSSK